MVGWSGQSKGNSASPRQLRQNAACSDYLSSEHSLHLGDSVLTIGTGSAINQQSTEEASSDDATAFAFACNVVPTIRSRRRTTKEGANAPPIMPVLRYATRVLNALLFSVLKESSPSRVEGLRMPPKLSERRQQLESDALNPISEREAGNLCGHTPVPYFYGEFRPLVVFARQFCAGFAVLLLIFFEGRASAGGVALPT